MLRACTHHTTTPIYISTFSPKTSVRCLNVLSSTIWLSHNLYYVDLCHNTCSMWLDRFHSIVVCLYNFGCCFYHRKLENCWPSIYIHHTGVKQYPSWREKSNIQCSSVSVHLFNFCQMWWTYDDCNDNDNRPNEKKNTILSAGIVCRFPNLRQSNVRILCYCCWWCCCCCCWRCCGCCCCYRLLHFIWCSSPYT